MKFLLSDGLLILVDIHEELPAYGGTQCLPVLLLLFQQELFRLTFSFSYHPDAGKQQYWHPIPLS